MRCQSCQKFVSYEGGEEPEILSEEIDQGGAISVEVHLPKNCGDCGTELAYADFTLEDTIDIPEDHEGDDHRFELELDTPEQTDRVQDKYYNKKKKEWMPLKSAMRYRKSFYGVSVSYRVNCSCGAEIASGELSDEVQASALEEA